MLGGDEGDDPIPRSRVPVLPGVYRSIVISNGKRRIATILFMTSLRRVPLYDGRTLPRTWNEQMQEGEYAVHYTSFKADDGSAPYCTIFETLAEASTHAEQMVAADPVLGCTIYDARGAIGAPLRAVRGTSFKGESGLSARFRRWAGLILFFCGLLLIVLDWSEDFRLSWPAMVGSRMVIPGLVLLVAEAVILFQARLHREHASSGEAP